MVQMTTNGPKGLYPDAVFHADKIVPDALIHQIATATVPVEGDAPVVRVPYVAEDPSVGFVAEGAPIPLDDAELSEVLIHTQKLAVLSSMSRESATHMEAEQYVANSMRRAVTTKADAAVLSNDTTPTGLLSVEGMIDGGTLAPTDLDVLSDAITEVEANGGTVTHLVMDPKAWGALRKLKTSTDSAQLLLGSPAEQTERRLFGIPVLVSAQMSPGSILISDRSNVVASIGQIQVVRSAHAMFDRDSYAYRVTWRFGWNVIHPDRLARVTLDLPTDA